MQRISHSPNVERSLRSLALSVCVVVAVGAHASAIMSPPPPGVRLSEIAVHSAQTDAAEFVEIQGPPNASLATFMLLVVDGDGTNAGVLDRAIDLSAYSIPASGYFVLGDSGVFPKSIDLGLIDQIENGTSTYYLVTTNQAGFATSLVGTRIDTGPATTSIPTFATIVDEVGIADADFPSIDVVYDAAVVVGPDGPFVPAGIARCSNAPQGWSAAYSDYDPNFPTALAPSPGAANPPCDPGVPYCFGDGSGTSCPCGNASPIGQGVGCLHQLGLGAKLRAVGLASLSADTLVLQGSQLPPFGPTLFFQGTTQLLGGAGALFGDGLFCAGGVTTRLGIKFNDGVGASQFPTMGDFSVSVAGFQSGPGLRTYQAWYRDSAGFCTHSGFNLSNGIQVDWIP